jgi:hypothetical protein
VTIDQKEHLMAYEMRAGQGSLFKNDKRTEEKHPNAKGKIMLPNGEVRWISAWTKTTSAGEKWQSLSIGDLVDGGQVQAKPVVVESDDDIPF